MVVGKEKREQGQCLLVLQYKIIIGVPCVVVRCHGRPTFPSVCLDDFHFSLFQLHLQVSMVY